MATMLGYAVSTAIPPPAWLAPAWHALGRAGMSASAEEIEQRLTLCHRRYVRAGGTAHLTGIILEIEAEQGRIFTEEEWADLMRSNMMTALQRETWRKRRLEARGILL